MQGKNEKYFGLKIFNLVRLNYENLNLHALLINFFRLTLYFIHQFLREVASTCRLWSDRCTLWSVSVKTSTLSNARCRHCEKYLKKIGFSFTSPVLKYNIKGSRFKLNWGKLHTGSFKDFFNFSQNGEFLK